MPKALVVFATRTGNTRMMAEAIAEGLGAAGVEVKVMDANDVAGESELAGFDAYLFGSATMHHEVIQDMQKVLAIAKKANLKGKTGGAFGAYGWSGEASGKIHEAMEFVNGMDVIDKPLKIQTPGSAESLRKSSEAYGREVGQIIQSHNSTKASI